MKLFWVLTVALALLALAPLSAGADPEVGKKIFNQKCAMCHGPDGKGNAKMQEKLKVTIPELGAAVAKTDSELLKIVSEGKRPMPAFGKTLSKDELDAVVHYAKDLAKAQTAGK